MADKRQAVCVIVAGMHRSGTSALTRVLSLLGCSLPTNLLAANSGNETGYWEPAKIMELNDRLLASAGCGWDDWTAVPADWFQSLEAAGHREEAAEIFKAEYPKARLTVLKDPRVCRLMPFWLDVLRDVGVDPVVAIPVRNPLEVVRSLAERDGSDPHHNRLLWTRHVLDAERYSRGVPRYFCAYDTLLENWSAVMSQMSEALGVRWPRMSAQTVMDVEAFLKPQHRRHELDPALFLRDRNESEWLKTTFSVVSRWALTAEDAEGTGDLDRIAAALEEASAAFSMIALKHKQAATRLHDLEAQQVGALAESAGRVEALEGELATARDQLAEMASQAEGLQAALQTAQQEMETERTNAEAIAARLHQTELEKGRLEEEAARAAGVLAELDASRAERASLDAALSTARERLDALEMQLAEVRAASQDEISILEGQLAEERAASQGAVGAAEERSRGLEAELAEVRAASQREISILEGQLAEERAASQGAVGAAEERSRGLEAELAEVRAAWQREIALLEGQLAEERARAADTTLHLRTRVLELEAVKRELLTVQAAVSTANGSAAEATAEADQLRARAVELESGLKSAEHKAAGLAVAIETMQLRHRSEHQLQQSRLDELSERVTRMAAELDRKESALKQRSAEVDDAYRDIEVLKERLEQELEGKEQLLRALEVMQANVDSLGADAAEKDQRVVEIQSRAEEISRSSEEQLRRIGQLLSDSQIRIEALIREVILQPSAVVSLPRAAMRRKIKILKRAGIVDREFYTTTYPEVVASGLEPEEHFLLHGYMEGRRPRP